MPENKIQPRHIMYTYIVTGWSNIIHYNVSQKMTAGVILSLSDWVILCCFAALFQPVFSRFHVPLLTDRKVVYCIHSSQYLYLALPSSPLLIYF